MHPGCGTLESSACVYAPDAPTAVRATASAVNAYTNALSFLTVLRDAIARRFSTRVERRSIVLERWVFRVLVLGSSRPSARRDVRDDVHVWRHRSMIRPARILSTKLRDATRRTRCCDGRIGARCAPSYAPSRRRSRGSRTHIIITALLQKCTSLRTVCPTLSHTIFYGYFRDSELSYSSLSYTRVREYDETRATAADARVDTMPTRT